MDEWKKRLSEYDQQIVAEAELKMNIGPKTIQYPLKTVERDGIVDFNFTPPVTLMGNYNIARHFLEQTFDGRRPVKILEVGAKPILLELYLKTNGGSDFATSLQLALMGGIDSLKYPLAAHLSRLSGTRVCANDIENPPRMADWLSADFIPGDFREERTRNSITDSLCGYPDVVIGEYVFVENLGKHQAEMCKPVSGNIKGLGEELTRIAWNLLADDGYMMVNNGRGELFGRDYLPEPLKGKTISHFYWDSFTQIFQKERSQS